MYPAPTRCHRGFQDAPTLFELPLLDKAIVFSHQITLSQ